MNKIKFLKNIKIIEKLDKNAQVYYIIFNNDNTGEAYFCFEKAVKDGWADFQQHWKNISEIEFEYQEQEKGNKVINIINHDQSLDIFL